MDTDFSKLPNTETCKIIHFSETAIRPGIVNDTYILIVSGTKAYINIDVRLSPRFYPKQPEYWAIEVVGCLTGIALPATAPYQVVIPLDGIRGTEGIEVKGASPCKEIKI